MLGMLSLSFGVFFPRSKFCGPPTQPANYENKNLSVFTIEAAFGNDEDSLPRPYFMLLNEIKQGDPQGDLEIDLLLPVHCFDEYCDKSDKFIITIVNN